MLPTVDISPISLVSNLIYLAVILQGFYLARSIAIFKVLVAWALLYLIS
jgi:hypothetical protein